MQIYLSTWTFKRQIERSEMTLINFPKLAVDNGFSGIEIMDRQLLGYPSDDLAVLRERAQDVDCRLIFDASTDLTLSEPRQWQEQIRYVISLLELSKNMGVEKLRILLGGQSLSFQKLSQKSKQKSRQKKEQQGRSGLEKLLINNLTVSLGNKLRKLRSGKVRHQEAKMERAILALQQIMPEAETMDMPVIIENHWGISSYPETILQIIEAVDSPLLGTCPDFDNFPRGVDPYQGLETLMSRARHVHAKSRTFNKMGEERNIDYSRCIRIVREADFDGSITVEYEGSGDVLLGSVKTLDLIKKNW